MNLEVFMPDKRTHRGAHPRDAALFAPEKIDAIRSAGADFSLLLGKGYADKSSLKLVGDRYNLTHRQRLAVMRSACSKQQFKSRKSKQIDTNRISGKRIVIDGYNLLITIEAALAKGIIILCQDGCYRDLASVHGTYRKVAETVPAIELIADFLDCTGPVNVLWLLDKPVSNSGRLRALIENMAKDNAWQWTVELVMSPDALLIQTDEIVATSDSVILDSCRQWVNLAAEIITQKLPTTEVLDLSLVNGIL